jgi:hypothetical protein
MRLGINNTKKLMKQLRVAGKKIPKKGSHLVSSNTAYVNDENLIADATQADPRILPKEPKSITPLCKPTFGTNWLLFTCHPKNVGLLRSTNWRDGSKKSPLISLNELQRILSIFNAFNIIKDDTPMPVNDTTQNQKQLKEKKSGNF